MSPPAARTLVLVSKDYGELGLAISLLRGENFARGARVLLPSALFDGNQQDLPAPATAYSDINEVLAVLDEHQPDVVFLFSGYLYSNDQLLSIDDVLTLLDKLEELGCRVVTSDPFLGMAQRFSRSTVDTDLLLKGKSILTRWWYRLILKLRAPEPALRLPSLSKLVHLYPTSIPENLDPDQTPRALSFFNPALVVSDHRETPSQERRWLFVMSSTDLECQRLLLGIKRFAKFVACILERTLVAGKRPTLIAPQVMVDILSAGLSDEISFVPFCSFSEFQTQLLDAEYVFYWNAFSFSMLPRVTNELPVFLFDQGHLAQFASWSEEPFYQHALKCHFGGWSPPYLDQEHFDPDALAELAEKQRPAMRAIRGTWEQSPTPDELVNRLMHEPESGQVK